MLRINLINERKKMQLTQAETANLVGIAVRQYKNLEAGASEGSIKVWKKLSDLFKQTIDYLLAQEVKTN